MGKRCGCGRGCETFGQCLRNKGIQIGDLKGRGTNKRWDRNLDGYADARRQGLQPKSTRPNDVKAAVQRADV